jgi:hypothetical protein
MGKSVSIYFSEGTLEVLNSLCDRGEENKPMSHSLIVARALKDYKKKQEPLNPNLEKVAKSISYQVYTNVLDTLNKLNKSTQEVEEVNE